MKPTTSNPYLSLMLQYILGAIYTQWCVRYRARRALSKNLCAGMHTKIQYLESSIVCLHNNCGKQFRNRILT